MNKAELVDIIFESGGGDITKVDIECVLNSFVSVVTNTVNLGEQVKLSGLGTFLSKQTKARKGRNPKTGEEIEIKAKTSPKFKASSDFKKLLIYGQK